MAVLTTPAAAKVISTHTLCTHSFVHTTPYVQYSAHRDTHEGQFRGPVAGRGGVGLDHLRDSFSTTSGAAGHEAATLPAVVLYHQGRGGATEGQGALPSP